MTWPRVLTEGETLDMLLQGRSIARYGDGELRILEGNAAIAQKWHPVLAKRLRDILRNADWECVVGIPQFATGPKKEYWSNYRRFSKYLVMKSVYGSAFITRPDSAPWINQAGYWERVRKLWAGKDVALVRGSDKSLTPDLMPEAKSVTEIDGPGRDAFDEYNELMAKCQEHSTILLCLGPAATVMAHALSLEGKQALDVGHLGMFLRKHIRGEAMLVTEEDKAVDRQY